MPCLGPCSVLMFSLQFARASSPACTWAGAAGRAPSAGSTMGELQILWQRTPDGRVTNEQRCSCQAWKMPQGALAHAACTADCESAQSPAACAQRAEIRRGFWCARAGLLNLVYDAMPAEYVTLIITEFGAIPPTSVPVILREYRSEPVL